MFDHFINALPKESLRTVLELITDPLEDEPNEQMKNCLCLSELRGFQQVEKLHQMDAPFLPFPWFPLMFHLSLVLLLALLLSRQSPWSSRSGDLTVINNPSFNNVSTGIPALVGVLC